jgi:hypothetical protein
MGNLLDNMTAEERKAFFEELRGLNINPLIYKMKSIELGSIFLREESGSLETLVYRVIDYDRSTSVTMFDFLCELFDEAKIDYRITDSNDRSLIIVTVPHPVLVGCDSSLIIDVCSEGDLSFAHIYHLPHVRLSHYHYLNSHLVDVSAPLDILKYIFRYSLLPITDEMNVDFINWVCRSMPV